jgi:hypothetical protein
MGTSGIFITKSATQLCATHEHFNISTCLSQSDSCIDPRLEVLLDSQQGDTEQRSQFQARANRKKADVILPILALLQLYYQVT